MDDEELDDIGNVDAKNEEDQEAIGGDLLEI